MRKGSCPGCGSQEVAARRFATASEDDRPYELLRCASCGSEWLPEVPEPAELSSLYEAGAYGPSAGLLDHVVEPVRKLMDRDRMRLIGRLPVGARVIEVGAGRGRTLKAMQARGHDAVGIEPALSSSRAAETGGVRVASVGVEDAVFPAGQADLVIFWHVVEHLVEPRLALERARDWLAPWGRVVIAVPNRDSFQARLGGDRWFHQDVPRHLSQFGPRGIDALLARSGFRRTSTRQLMVDQNVPGMWLTLLNLVTSARDVPFRLLKRDLEYDCRWDALRDAVVAPIAGLVLLPVAVMLELAAGLTRRGGTLVVHAEPT